MLWPKRKHRGAQMGEVENLDSIVKHAECLPIFPLQGMVLFPDTIVPLHIFEPRYIQLIDDSFQTHQLVCMPNLRFSMGEGEVPDVHTVAGVGKIIKKMDLPDNRYFILVKGIGTVDITSELESERLYRQVCTTVREQSNEIIPMESQSEIRLLLQSVLLHGANKIKQLNQITSFLEMPEIRMAELNALAGGCVRDPNIRQAYLETSDLELRIEYVTNGLADALVALMDEES
ncbi:MAG: LON peptidase substrate-binding domain-containing protein [Myxococcota bacterium]|nr:LON peptidase substrate-binding domain-containing protein [Myxococcota bacterium]